MPAPMRLGRLPGSSVGGPHAGDAPGVYVTYVSPAARIATAIPTFAVHVPLAQNPLAQSLGPRHPPPPPQGAHEPPQSTPVSLPSFMPFAAPHAPATHSPTSQTPPLH